MFVNKQSGGGGEILPGSGLEVDLDRRVCPECGRESPPWEAECRDCGVTTLPPEQVPSAEDGVAHLLDHLDEPDGDDGGDRRS